jgi:LAGLIDADG endonuclease
MLSPVEMAQPSRSRRLAESNRCLTPQGVVSASAPLQLALVQHGCTDEEGYRLASLADGEGCFSIARSGNTDPKRRPRGGGYTCAFIVKMRADDTPFLERFAAIFGGRIRHVGDVRQDGRARAPQVTWSIDTKAGCRSLVDIFDRYPLWSKKRRDYLIWREAVLFWSSVRGRSTDWASMARLYVEIKAVKKYEGFDQSFDAKRHGNRVGIHREGRRHE